ncbi:MAG: PilZ domain-containing protein [Brevinemataceae bacterium]
MINFIFILSIVALIYIFTTIKTPKKSKNLFSTGKLILSTSEALKLINQKAKLSPYEAEKLEYLYSLNSRKLYQALNDEQIGRQWLISTYNMISNPEFEHKNKEDLLLASYEIYRKINNYYIQCNSSIQSINDISIGQNADIEILYGPKFFAEFLNINSKTITFLLNNSNKSASEYLNYTNRNADVSFWKKMDAGYEFSSNVVKFMNNNNSLLLVLKTPSNIKRTTLREYPRKECELPVKIRANQIRMSETTGSLEEISGHLTLGLVRNISIKGCNIISRVGIAQDTMISLEITLDFEELNIKGIIRRTVCYSDIYVLHVEFLSNITKKEILAIYNFIFSEYF